MRLKKKLEQISPVFPKYFVFKVEDLDDCLNIEQREQLAGIIESVQKIRLDMGKDPNPTYTVVSEEEPYSDMVKELIDKEERKYHD